MDFKSKYGFSIAAIIFGAIGIIYSLTSGSVVATRIFISGLMMIGVGIALAWQAYDT